jgi:hypothetical protein
MIQTTMATIAAIINAVTRAPQKAPANVQMLEVTSTLAPVANAPVSALLKLGKTFQGRFASTVPASSHA